jgi:hypothetical protein
MWATDIPVHCTAAARAASNPVKLAWPARATACNGPPASLRAPANRRHHPFHIVDETGRQLD